MAKQVFVPDSWHHVVVSSSVFGAIHLISGPQRFLAQRAVNELVARAKEIDPEAELVELNGQELAERPFAQIATGSLFASSNIVVINEVTNAPADQLAQIQALLKEPNPELALILVHSGGQKGRSFISALQKAKVNTFKAEQIKAFKLPDFVQSEASRLGVRIRPEVSRALIEAIGNDPAGLAGALTQLVADAQGQPLTVELVGQYFSGRAEVTSYKVVDEILAGRLSSALEKLRWALATGTQPVAFTVALAGSLRLLGRFLALKDQIKSDDEIAQQLDVPSWKIRDIRKKAGVWQPNGISQALIAVAEADAGVKGQAADAEYALEQLLFKLSDYRRLR